MRIRESELVEPARLAIRDAGGEISTAALIERLAQEMGPVGENAAILAGRLDTKFSQKVRNLKSHKTLERTGRAIATGGGFRLL